MKLFIAGASRGLGMWLSVTALQNGHTVFAGCRSVNNIQPPLHTLVDSHSEQLHVLEMDVQQEASVQKAARFIKETSGNLDGIINNAGILLGRGKPLQEANLEDFEKTFDINVFGPIRVLKHMLPLLNKAKAPAVVNISSDCASMSHAVGDDYPYAMSKAALNMLSHGLKAQLKNIPVYAVHPGWIQTDMGGKQAPGDPKESAQNILRLMEKQPEIEENAVFIDHYGKPMDG